MNCPHCGYPQVANTAYCLKCKTGLRADLNDPEAWRRALEESAHEAATPYELLPPAGVPVALPEAPPPPVSVPVVLPQAPPTLVSVPVALPQALPTSASYTWTSGGTETYAGFQRRLAAFIIDYFILWMGCGILGMHLLTKGYQVSIFGWTLSWLYWAAMESSTWQASLGKLILGIKVTDLEGKRITFWQSMGRNFCKLFSAAIFGIGFLLAGITPKKQALHDLLAQCLVVKK